MEHLFLNITTYYWRKIWRETSWRVLSSALQVLLCNLSVNTNFISVQMCLRLVALETSFDVRNVDEPSVASIAQCIVIGKKSGSSRDRGLYLRQTSKFSTWLIVFYANKVKFTLIKDTTMITMYRFASVIRRTGIRLSIIIRRKSRRSSREGQPE